MFKRNLKKLEIREIDDYSKGEKEALQAIVDRSSEEIRAAVSVVQQYKYGEELVDYVLLQDLDKLPDTLATLADEHGALSLIVDL